MYHIRIVFIERDVNSTVLYILTQIMRKVCRNKHLKEWLTIRCKHCKGLGDFCFEKSLYDISFK